MEELRHSYSRLCKERGAEPQETVLQQLQELPWGRLDLATQSLTVDTCRALGALLQEEALLTELILSDCMLSEEGGHPEGRQGPGQPLPHQSWGWGPALPLRAAWTCFVRPGLPHVVHVAWRPPAQSSSVPSDFVLVGFPLCLYAVKASHSVLGSRGQFLFAAEKS